MDVTLELKELEAALLSVVDDDDDGENEIPLANNIDDSFLKFAASYDEKEIESILDSITSKANRLKQELSNATLSLAPNMNSTFTVSNSVAGLERVETLQAELSKCSQNLVSHASLGRFETEERDSYEVRKNRISKLEHLVSALHLLASHQRFCDDFDREIENCNLLEAAVLLQSMDNCSAEMSKISSNNNKNSSATISASRVAKSCRSQCKSRRASLQARLDESLMQAIQFDANTKKSLVINFEITTERLKTCIRLEKVLEALKLLKTLNSRLNERLVEPLLNDFLKPIFNQKKNEINYIKIEQDLQDSNSRCLKLLLVENNNNNLCINILNNVQLILRFIWSEVFNRDTLMNSQLNIYQIIEPYLKNVLINAVPESIEDLALFRIEILERVQNFDQELNLIGSTSKINEKLFSFVSNVDENFAKKLNQKFGEKARDCIKSSDLQFYEKVIDGTEPEFFVGNKGEFSIPGEMQISKCARNIVLIANECLKEACSGSNEIFILALIKSCRNCFDLFRVLVPFLRKDEILTNPRCAMLHRNDFIYIGHHLVMLSHRYRNLKSLVTVDLAPFFFDEADEVYKKEIQLRCQEIESMFFGGSIDFSNILAKSDSIYKAWSEVLPLKLVQTTKIEIGEALSNGAFQGVCSKESNVSSISEKRQMLKKLTQFSEAIKIRGGNSKKIDQLCKALQPHMSLFPLFSDLVESELSDWPSQNLIGLANALFSKTSTKEELKQFEEKILFY